MSPKCHRSSNCTCSFHEEKHATSAAFWDHSIIYGRERYRHYSYLWNGGDSKTVRAIRSMHNPNGNWTHYGHSVYIYIHIINSNNTLSNFIPSEIKKTKNIILNECRLLFWRVNMSQSFIYSRNSDFVCGLNCSLLELFFCNKYVLFF